VNWRGRTPPNRALAAVVLATSLLFPACQPGPAPKAGKETDATVRPVRVARVRTKPMERFLPAFGSLVAPDQSIISVKVAGRVEQLPVDLGTAVKAGDLIAQLDRRDYELRLEQAQSMLAQARARLGLPTEGTDDQVDPEKTSLVKQAQALLVEAQKNRERISRLFSQGVIPQSELEGVEASYQVALNRNQDALEEARNRQALLAQRRVEWEIARKALSDTSLRAPFAGTVQRRIAHLGEYLAAGTPVVELVKAGGLRLRLEVSERDSIQVQHGQPVRLWVEGDQTVHTGQLTRLSPMLQPENRMLIVEADVPSGGQLRPGLFVRAEIVTRTNDPAFMVPADAVVTFAGIEKVFVVVGDEAKERQVTTGRTATDEVEIINGLKEGEIVVREPGNLRTGQKLKVRTES
jgi:RND family efflux transporter MFP subunit